MTRLGKYETRLGVEPWTLSHVFECHEDVGAAVVGVNQASRIHKEGALADVREVMLDLEADRRRSLGYHCRE